MPTQWILTATPAPPTAPAPLSHLHALACHLVESPGSAHTAQLKPFTAALPPVGGTANAAAPRNALLLAWLDEPTEPSEPDLKAKLKDPVRLGPHLTRLTLTSRNAIPYVRLAATPPVRKVRVEFSTPAYVSRAERQLPLPDPELLLNGLARRWTAFSPCPLSPKALAEALALVHLARHGIRTVLAGTGGNQRVGFVGQATFGLPAQASRAAQRVFTALWAFAEFSGVGAQTTHGLGHVRVRPGDPPHGSVADAGTAREPASDKESALSTNAGPSGEPVPDAEPGPQAARTVRPTATPTAEPAKQTHEVPTNGGT